METQQDRDQWGRLGGRLAVIAIFLGGATFALDRSEDDALSAWVQIYCMFAGLALVVLGATLTLILAGDLSDRFFGPRWRKRTRTDVNAWWACIVGSAVISLAISAAIGDATGNYYGSVTRAVFIFSVVFVVGSFLFLPWREVVTYAATLIVYFSVAFVVTAPLIDHRENARKTARAEMLTLCGTLAGYPDLKQDLRERCLAEGEDRLESLIKEMKPSDP